MVNRKPGPPPASNPTRKGDQEMKKWIEIWGKGPTHSAPVLLARVSSIGLAYLIVTESISQHYSAVTIK